MIYQIQQSFEKRRSSGFISAKKILFASCLATIALGANAGTFTSCTGPNADLTTTYDISNTVSTAVSCAILNPLDGNVNDSEATVNQERFFNTSTWVFDGKYLDAPASGFFNFTGGTTSGTYTFNNKVAPGLYDYLFIFKDGNSTNLVGYLLTVAGGLTGNYGNPFTAPPFTLTGNASERDISHISVYYRDQGFPNAEIPEPGTTAILGLGLLGMGMISLRGRKKQS